jgi:hypothetical protein
MIVATIHTSERTFGVSASFSRKYHYVGGIYSKRQLKLKSPELAFDGTFHYLIRTYGPTNSVDRACGVLIYMRYQRHPDYYWPKKNEVPLRSCTWTPD